MTRLLTLTLASLITASTAFATPSADFGESAMAASSIDADFLQADISFMDAMRALSTITLPDTSKMPELSGGPTLRIRTAVPPWRTDLAAPVEHVYL